VLIEDIGHHSLNIFLRDAPVDHSRRRGCAGAQLLCISVILAPMDLRKNRHRSRRENFIVDMVGIIAHPAVMIMVCARAGSVADVMAHEAHDIDDVAWALAISSGVPPESWKA